MKAAASIQIDEALPARHAVWRDTMFTRARSFLANAFFESFAATGRMHPAAAPKRHGVELESDLAYGPDKAHRLDIYRPVHRPKPWPVVFYVHGGAFHLLSKDTHWLMGLVFARFGYMVVNISYRLAPKHPFPAAIEDAARGAHAFDRPVPPFFAPVGTRDPLLDDTRRLEKALATLNVPCEARYYPGGIHAFHALVWDPAARRCWRDALAFLDRHMR